MTTKVLQEVLNESPTGWKNSCDMCIRRSYCQRMHKVLASLAQASETHNDLEYRIRFRSLLQALVSLGYDFPEGQMHCSLADLDSREARDLLREAQELLIEVRESPMITATDRA